LGGLQLFGRAQAHEKLPTAARLAATVAIFWGTKCNLLLHPTTKHDFENFRRVNCPVVPPGCGPAYHQQHCMLTAKAGSSAEVIPCLCQVRNQGGAGGQPPTNFFAPWKNVLNIVRT